MSHRLLTLFAGIAMLAGCSANRTTTTTRTALEQALLSEAAERTVSKFPDPGMAGKKFFLDLNEFEATDAKYVQNALRARLTGMGLHAAAKQEEADIIVYPRQSIANIDDGSFLLGIPSFPIIIPGAGSISTPELAFFKRASQQAYNKMGLYAIDAKTGKQVFDLGRKSSGAYLTRWTLFIFFGWTATDMPTPYTEATDEAAAASEASAQ